MTSQEPTKRISDSSRFGDFSPEKHRSDLIGIIRAIENLPDNGKAIPLAEMDRILRLHPRDGVGFYSRAEIIAGARYFSEVGALKIDEQRMVHRLQLRPIRTQSGVTPVTVLTKPFPCPGKCVFCPNDVRMPKSYLADEPGAQRAAGNDFDPYLQVWSRLETYYAIGHSIDKVELIVLGGTWSFHPESYQIWFVKRCFDALNDFANPDRAKENIQIQSPDFSVLSSRPGQTYNETIGGYLRDLLGGSLLAAHEAACWEDLEIAQKKNETCRCRNVGLVVETRPDHLSEDEILRIRRLGCTKVQIGYQSLSDEILELNQRGHGVSETRSAMRRLRAAGLKIHAHWMPNLLGATPEGDLQDFERIFADPDFRPDELKIYPCSLIETAELMNFYEKGDWRPYEHDELLEVIVGAMARVPRYCRVTRVIRDISSDDIVAGNKLTNFRQIAQDEMVRRGLQSVDIRAREVGGQHIDLADFKLRETEYATSVGQEVFFEMVGPQDRIAGFVRLCLPAGPVSIGEIRQSALLREVHVYGAATELGHHSTMRAQHRGLGQSLVSEAGERARQAGFDDLAVISAVGTRPWYRRLGFVDGSLYQHLALE